MHRIFGSLLVAAALACTSTLAPTHDLSGTWSTPILDVGTLMTLTQQGTALTGTGTTRNNASIQSFQVHGSYAPPWVSLTFNYDSGLVCQYTATVQDANDIAGAETCGGGPQGLTNFSRR